MRKVEALEGQEDGNDNINNNNNQQQRNSSAPRPSHGQSYAREMVSLDASDPKLATTSLTWSLLVQQHHHNHTLTCVGKHLAFEQREFFPDLFGKELRKFIRLEVLHEPEVELKVEQQLPLIEHKAAKFECQARARPEKLSYKWFLDDQLILNATESELYVPSVTRQLHFRLIKCEVTNAIGSSFKELQLSVRYSPAYISHLLAQRGQSNMIHSAPLPAPEEVALSEYQMDAHYVSGKSNSGPGNAYNSQPRVVSSPSLNGKFARRLLHHTNQRPPVAQLQHRNHHPTTTTSTSGAQALTSAQASNADNILEWPPQMHELFLGRQLAMGFDDYQEVKLRCDFDSNPKPDKIEWFKLSSEYSVMAEVSPREADDLMDYGLAQAYFLTTDDGKVEGDRKKSTTSAWRTSGGGSSKMDGGSLVRMQTHSKRHIATSIDSMDSDQSTSLSSGDDSDDGTAGLQFANDGDSFIQETLDYDKMSHDLLEELAYLQQVNGEQQQRASTSGLYGEGNATSGSYRTVEGITPYQHNHSSGYIREPLSWSVITSELEADKLEDGRYKFETVDKPDGPARPQDEWAASSGPQRNVPSLILHKRPLSSNQTINLPTRLTQRQASITSSMITIRAANEDSIGQYVCRARQQKQQQQQSSGGLDESKSPRQFNTMARSIYLVRRQQPRIISARRQEAAIGSPILQVECMAQINTVIDNQTTISWSKDGKVSGGVFCCWWW